MSLLECSPDAICDAIDGRGMMGAEERYLLDITKEFFSRYRSQREEERETLEKRRRTRNRTDFIARSYDRHGDRYGYFCSLYSGSKEKISIWCTICQKIFWKLPSDHMRGGGCPKCSTHRGYSRACIEWLDVLNRELSIDIQHAENGGEFRIPGTRYLADGYCRETNTIYEFHGDYWHGNPLKYHPSKVNESCHKTFGELYRKTLQKERDIKALGYNYICLWEREWNIYKKSL